MIRRALACLVVAGALWGAEAGAQPETAAIPAAQQGMVIVAVRDDPEPMPSVGATPRADYRHMAGYAGSTQSAALADEVARDHGLSEAAFWTIDPLRWRCMLYRLPPGSSQTAMLARLKQDPRVQLAQPLNSFETLTAPPAPAPAYNDPYFKLQRGFAAMGTGRAHRWSRGQGVVVALIDTGVDGAHPDLAGRVAAQRDFVGPAQPVSGAEKHGTEMAGVIAADADNNEGIVGMAPQARILAYRACWAMPAPANGVSRCDSFTLARAMGAAIAADADIINLSLGGPADPLLAQLAMYAIKRGAIVVGAVPPGGRLDGFPLNVPGVLAAASDDEPMSASRVLAAPGRDVLTLTPGGHYDYASGGSVAAAHVTGAAALLRALDSTLRADAVQALLSRPARGGELQPARWTVDVCAAVRQLRAEANCASATPLE